MIKYYIRKCINIVRSWFGLPPLLRKLSGKWTVDNAVALVAMHGLDVEDELARILADEIRIEVDAEVLAKYILTTPLMRINHKYKRRSIFDTMQDSRKSDVDLMMKIRKPRCRTCRR